MRNLDLINISFIAVILFIFINQTNCSTYNSNVLLYIEPNNKEVEKEINKLLNSTPNLIIGSDSIEAVTVTQKSIDSFTLEVILTNDVKSDIKNITSTNIGNKLVFISNNNILLSPLILNPIDDGVIFIELSQVNKKNVLEIARQFKKSFKFVDNRIANKQIDSKIKIARSLCESQKYNQAFKIYNNLLSESKNNSKVHVYDEIALCYFLKGEESEGIKTFIKLINVPIDVDLDNYFVIYGAHFQIYLYEKEHMRLNIANTYLDRGIEILNHIIKQYPVTQSAQWANLGIATSELMRGNVYEAQLRIKEAKSGDFGAEAYLLLGLTYEYDKKFKKAIKEYELLIDDYPNSAESQYAKHFITNINNNISNLDKYLPGFGINE